jgi:hypothetical protein
MKRSEIIKKIVAESYEARKNALHEAEKTKTLTQIQPDAISAPTATGAAYSAAPGTGAGASSSGGATAIVKVRQLVRDTWAHIAEGDKFFGKKKDADEKNSDKLFFRYEDDAIAEAVKAADATFLDPPDGHQIVRETMPVSLLERIFKEDPFGDGPELIVPEKELELVSILGDPPAEVHISSDDYEQAWDKGVEVQDEFEKIGDEAVLIKSFNDTYVSPPPNGFM